MKILLCASSGAFLAHLELLDSATASKIGKITTTMLLPALLFCSLSESITVDAIARLWFLPVSCLFIILFGTAMGFFLSWALRMDPNIRSVAAACAGFGNAQGFPLVLMATIAEKLYDAEKQLLGLAYLSMYLIGHSSLLWALAPVVVRPRKAAQSPNSENGEADNIPMVQSDAEAASQSSDATLVSAHQEHDAGAMGTSDGGHDYLASERIRAAMRRASARVESGAEIYQQNCGCDSPPRSWCSIRIAGRFSSIFAFLVCCEEWMGEFCLESCADVRASRCTFQYNDDGGECVLQSQSSFQGGVPCEWPFQNDKADICRICSSLCAAASFWPTAARRWHCGWLRTHHTRRPNIFAHHSFAKFHA